MKRFLFLMFATVTMLTSALGLSSCGKHTHSYSDTVTNPTCTEKGYTTHTCSCGESFIDSYVDALGHSFENNICTVCEEHYYSEGLKFTLLDDDTYSVSKGDFTGNSLVIPEIYNGKPVTDINEKGFYYCDSIKNVTIPNSIKKIGYQAFSFSGLKAITIPDSVEIINDSAFANCQSLESVTLSNNITEISRELFYYCELLKEITIPNSVKFIKSGAFSNCRSLKNIVLPNSVRWIDKQSFFCCSSLENITLSNEMVDIGESAFYGCISLESIIVPNRVNWIGKTVFSGCTSLSSVTIGKNVSSIGEKAFADCTSLKEITIPDSVIEIGEFAFNGCSSLESMTLPFTGKSATVSNIYEGVFGYIFGYKTTKNQSDFTDDVTVQYLEQPNSSTLTTYYLYYIPKSIKSVTITGNSINSYAFSSCTSLTNVTIGNRVKSIEKHAFSSCTSLTNVTIGNRVKSIEKHAFSSCTSLTNITIGNGVNTIGNNAFMFCSSLETITIPNSVESIGSFAFSYCTLIKSLVMGNGINIINDHIFYYGNLEKIYYYGTASDWGKIAIHEIAFDPNPTIYYYSETTPTDTGNYWHYVNESPTAW